MSNTSSRVALLHPGRMGAGIGAAIADGGHEVRWLTEGRSAATRDRADQARLVATDDLASLLDGTEFVLSVCPPQGARDVARMVAATGFSGTYVDANPVSAATLAMISAALKPTGATLIDGGIVGPPPRPGHRTHLYLSGAEASVTLVAALFSDSAVTPKIVGLELGAASAAKQAYAVYNKGRMLLAAAAADLADAHGVLDVLAAESDRPDAEILAELSEVREGLLEVGWRWAPEFEEIGQTVAAAGLDPALVRACLEVLSRHDR